MPTEKAKKKIAAKPFEITRQQRKTLRKTRRKTGGKPGVNLIAGKSLGEWGCGGMPVVGGNHKFGVKAEVDMDRDFFCGRVLAWRVWSAQRIAVVVFSVLSGVVVVFVDLVPA